MFLKKNSNLVRMLKQFDSLDLYEHSYLSELMQNAGQFTSIWALSVVLFSPLPSSITSSPCFLLPLASRLGSAARGVGGRSKDCRSTWQEGQNAGQSLGPSGSKNISLQKNMLKHINHEFKN